MHAQASFADAEIDITTACPQRWSNAEYEAREERHAKSEGEHAPVKAGGKVECLFRVREKTNEHARSAPCNQETRQATQQGKKQAFSEKLPEQPSTRCPDGKSNSDFT